MSEMGIFRQLCCLRMWPFAEQENSKRTSKDLKHKKDDDTYIERGSGSAGRNHEKLLRDACKKCS